MMIFTEFVVLANLVYLHDVNCRSSTLNIVSITSHPVPVVWLEWPLLLSLAIFDILELAWQIQEPDRDREIMYDYNLKKNITKL